MSTNRNYANPPVVEALCEVYFADAEWDDTVPGRFFERVQALGFSEKEPVERHEAQFRFGGTATPSAEVRSRPRMRFLTPDRSRLMQVEPSLSVVNQLPPYPSFEDWAPSVPDAAEVFADLVGNRGIEQVGLRYINRIDLDGTRIDLEDWFTVSPRLPPAWQEAAGTFLVRAQRRFSPTLGVILTFGSAPPFVLGNSSFMLDIYALHQLSTPAAVSALSSLMEEAHNSIESAFEGSITDKLRARF